jgi:hypothetical protein
MKVHLEEGELAAWIYYLLTDGVSNVEEVIVNNPKTCAWIARDRQKEDPVDARKLSELLRLGRTDEVFYPDDKALIVFKRTVQHYEAMNKAQIKIKQRIKGRLRTEGIIRTGRDGNGSLKDVSRSIFQNATRESMNNGVKRFYEASLRRTGDEDNARLNTQRKILAVMWSMWKKGRYVRRQGRCAFDITFHRRRTAQLTARPQTKPVLSQLLKTPCNEKSPWLLDVTCS